MTAVSDYPLNFTPTRNTLVLASVSTSPERALLEDWLSRQRNDNPHVDVQVLRMPAGRSPHHVVAQLVSLLGEDDERAVVPVRVFWMPDPKMSNLAKIRGLLLGRDPYRPDERRQVGILTRDSSRARIVAGEAATVADLRQQWRAATLGENPRDFANFVIRRAILALERVEYRLLGPQYKSPRLVKPEILASARFRAGLEQIPDATIEKAAKILDEMATGWSRLSVDLVPALARLLFSRGFEPSIDYDREQIESMRTALKAHPAVMLFSHRSNLDSAVLTVALHENRMPRAHVFGGINLAFGIWGALMRRAGVIFIRRNIGDDKFYKFVLKQYVGYLIEKRFNLSWSIEGTRSRTGKMLPPKLGLLSYVADTYLDGRSDDVLLQPVSISFDQLHETAEYAQYARGAEKTPEGLRWLYKFIKAQGERNYGKIYVRFPEPVSMRHYLAPGRISDTGDQSAKRLALQKMAFEAAWRILRSTPVNATALVSALLLTNRGVALTLDQMHHTLQDWLDYLERKQTPMTDSARRLRSHEGVRSALDALSNEHPVTCIDRGREPVWRIEPEHEHQASFYRNSIIHAFLETAIVDLALAYAARADEDPLQAFWAQVMRLRDLLKFDFYFADSAAFRAHVAEEMAWRAGWESHVANGGKEIDMLLREKRPVMAPAVLRPFFDAYELVADVLRDAPAVIGEKELTKLALGVGSQYAAQGRVRSTESVSALLFSTARQLAADQQLLEPSPAMVDRRAAFVAELRGILNDLDRLEGVAHEQFIQREQQRTPQQHANVAPY